jgi:hypothetical protein
MFKVNRRVEKDAVDVESKGSVFEKSCSSKVKGTPVAGIRVSLLLLLSVVEDNSLRVFAV